MLFVDTAINYIYTYHFVGDVVMPEIYQLRQLAAFAQYGTLSEAAEKLYLSQPALSRNMRKLEEDFGVPLFIRSKNKLELNENGKLAAELSVKALSEIDNIAKQVQALDRSRRTISFGICAPAPVWKISPLLTQFYPAMTIQTETAGEAELLNGLDTGRYHIAVLHFRPDTDKFCSAVCGTEKLFFSLPVSHKFAKEKSLSFADMDGENMLLMSDVGFWYDMTLRKMPHSRFLVQNDRYTFNELVSASVLPSFSTDLANEYLGTNADRVDIPIFDEEAEVTYYLVCLQKNKKQFERLFKHFG